MKMTYRGVMILSFIFGCILSSCGPSKEKQIKYLSSFHRITECGINDIQNCLVFATLINEDTVRDDLSGYTHNLSRLKQFQEIGIQDLEISRGEIRGLRDLDRKIKIKHIAENIIINLQHFYDTLLPNAIAKWEKGNKDPDIIHILQVSLDQNILECKMLQERMIEYATKHHIEKSSWESFTKCKQPEI